MVENATKGEKAVVETNIGQARKRAIQYKTPSNRNQVIIKAG